MDLLILGASARAAAFSALRAGLQPICADLFADRDLQAVAPAHRISRNRYPGGVARLAASMPAAPWMFTGALENHPDLVARIARSRPLWGNEPTTLRAVRDPIAVAQVLERAGLSVPKVRHSPSGLPRDGTWMVKPLASAGGQGVHPLGPDDPAPRRPSYYQERIRGASLSAVFLGHPNGAIVEGVTRQWVGRPGAPFAYVGSVGPWPIAPEVRMRIERLGRVLGAEFGLKGLFGVDFVLRRGQPWPVEINPRYTASVEVLELALGRALLADHRWACAPGEAPAGAQASPGPIGRPAMVAKRIVFATERGHFPDDVDVNPGDPFAIPEFGDVPHPGEEFQAGDPVMTLFATGASLAECRAGLARTSARWQRRLRAAPVSRFVDENRSRSCRPRMRSGTIVVRRASE